MWPRYHTVPRAYLARSVQRDRKRFLTIAHGPESAENETRRTPCVRCRRPIRWLIVAGSSLYMRRSVTTFVLRPPPPKIYRRFLRRRGPWISWSARFSIRTYNRPETDRGRSTGSGREITRKPHCFAVDGLVEHPCTCWPPIPPCPLPPDRPIPPSSRPNTFRFDDFLPYPRSFETTCAAQRLLLQKKKPKTRTHRWRIQAAVGVMTTPKHED